MTETGNESIWTNVAMVVSHPAHLIMVAGMVQRYRPKFLIIGASAVQESIIRKGFSMVGLEDSATFLELPDSESYKKVHKGDYSLHLNLGNTIFEWLLNVKPDVVIGDAYELSNFQHDITRLLLDNALRKYRHENPNVQNFEIPICCRTENGTQNVFYQKFPFGNYSLFKPKKEEVILKLAIADWASKQDDFIAGVCKVVQNVDEPYRSVPWDRDYTLPPAGLKQHYDDRGWEEVAAGNYEMPILFDKHFVPLVNELNM